MISAPMPENEAKRLKALRDLDILDTLEEQAYDDLTQLAAAIAGTPVALVSLIDDDRQWFKSHHGLHARETPRDVAFCSHVILADEPMVVNDARKDNRFHDNPLTTAAPDVIFYAGVPLKVDGEFNVGTLCVIDHQPRQLSEQQLGALQALARQVESQLRLRQKIKALQHLDVVKTEFVAMVSHELRSPLTSVCGSLALLASGKVGAVDASAQQLVNMANRNADLLLRLVNDILDLTKIETGHMSLQVAPHNAQALAQQVLAMNEGFAARMGCKQSYRGNDHAADLQINVDAPRLQQVLSNLLSNAIKHSEPNGTVVLEMSAEPDWVRFSVRNRGAGIPPEKHALLFKKFQQLENAGNERTPGTGLGLVISKQLVELHGGEIGFTSEPNAETCFYFTIPRLS